MAKPPDMPVHDFLGDTRNWEWLHQRLLNTVPLYIQESAPANPPEKYMWVEIIDANDMTIWIEDGS